MIWWLIAAVAIALVFGFALGTIFGEEVMWRLEGGHDKPKP